MEFLPDVHMAARWTLEAAPAKHGSREILAQHIYTRSNGAARGGAKNQQRLHDGAKKKNLCSKDCKV